MKEEKKKEFTYKSLLFLIFSLIQNMISTIGPAIFHYLISEIPQELFFQRSGFHFINNSSGFLYNNNIFICIQHRKEKDQRFVQPALGKIKDDWTCRTKLFFIKHLLWNRN